MLPLGIRLHVEVSKMGVRGSVRSIFVYIDKHVASGTRSPCVLVIVFQIVSELYKQVISDALLDECVVLGSVCEALFRRSIVVDVVGENTVADKSPAIGLLVEIPHARQVFRADHPSRVAKNLRFLVVPHPIVHQRGLVARPLKNSPQL